MVTVFDVASYILAKKGRMTTMKLQKLVYYAQAWSLVWDEKPLFGQRIEAWASGPVVPSLYAAHKGQFSVAHISGDARLLKAPQRATVTAILKHYGGKGSQWLSDLTHSEDPWIKARGNLRAGARGHREITRASMHEYYSGL